MQKSVPNISRYRLISRILVILFIAFQFTWISSGVYAQATDTKPIEISINEINKIITKYADQLKNTNTLDSQYYSILPQLIILKDSLSSNVEILNTALDESDQKLKDLGPAPAAKQPAESSNIAMLRKDLNAQISSLTGFITTANLDIKTIQDLIDEIHGKSRSRFLTRITHRTTKFFDKQSWIEIRTEEAMLIEMIKLNFSTWRKNIRTSGHMYLDAALVLFVIIVAVMLFRLPKTKRWSDLQLKLFKNDPPTGNDKNKSLALRTSIWSVIGLIMGALVYGLFIEFKIFDQDNQIIPVHLGLFVFGFIVTYKFSNKYFAPNAPTWRVVNCASDKAARTLQVLFISILSLFFIDRIFIVIFETSDAVINLLSFHALFSDVLFSLLIWMFLRQKLWEAKIESDTSGVKGSAEGADNEIIPTSKNSKTFDFTIKILRGSVIILLFTTLLGFIRLSNFIYHRALLIVIFGIILWSFHTVAYWGLSILPSNRKNDATENDDPSDYRAQTYPPLGFWLKFFLNMTFVALSIPLVMIVMGYDWLDIETSLDLSALNFTIGGLSISVYNIILSILTFFIVIVATHLFVRGMEKQIDNHHQFNEGTSNALLTIFKYIGYALAILIALPIMGVGLNKLAVIAGALSVGIGFGLRDIVSNFVSGLILLFEQPVKIGDWIVVPSGQGNVRHIGARATEITTFDKASILVPNSELVSSSVQNWYYKSRFGRIKIDIGVAYGSDPEKVQDILLDCAKKNPMILASPACSVKWLDFGDSSLDFQLRGFIRNYEKNLDVRSELRFAIFKAFKEAGIVIPFPQRDLNFQPNNELKIAGTEKVESKPVTLVDEKNTKPKGGISAGR